MESFNVLKPHADFLLERKEPAYLLEPSQWLRICLENGVAKL